MATNDKYDRQLRLWGANGQKRLAECHILLLRAGPTGTETLKNLVLPGIGNFTIVDDGAVTESDIANNFFLPSEALGKPRCEVACTFLCELNPDVKGKGILQDPLAFMKSCSSSLHSSFSLVVVTETSESELLEIESICQNAQVPLIIARTNGFVGICRISTPSHCVIESKPSPAPMEDLRIADPFPELAAFVDTIDVESLDNKDYKHVPYVVLLLKLAKRWKQEHDGVLPRDMNEKKVFREQIKSLARKAWGEEENLLEAYENAFAAYTPRPVPPEVEEEVFQDGQCESGVALCSTDTFSVQFWIMAKALKGFVNNEGAGKLPVSGILPDMTASTEAYISLQKIYKAKAKADAACVFDRVKNLLNEMSLPADSVTFEDVEHFCKNAYHLRALRPRSLATETSPASVNREEIEMAVMDGVGDSSPQCPLLFVFLLRACDRFHAKHGRYPGANGKLELGEESDVDALLQETQALLKECKLEDVVLVSLDHAREFVRYAGVELHNIAAVTGGIASQEAVKVITHQYTLLNNTYVFNGITCSGQMYQL